MSVLANLIGSVIEVVIGVVGLAVLAVGSIVVMVGVPSALLRLWHHLFASDIARAEAQRDRTIREWRYGEDFDRPFARRSRDNPVPPPPLNRRRRSWSGRSRRR